MTKKCASSSQSQHISINTRRQARYLRDIGFIQYHSADPLERYREACAILCRRHADEKQRLCTGVLLTHGADNAERAAQQLSAGLSSFSSRCRDSGNGLRLRVWRSAPLHRRIVHTTGTFIAVLLHESEIGFFI